MASEFNHDRLHVGFRDSDWSNVWYGRDGETNEDGDVDFSLFKFSTGGHERREPMESEVLWHPHFDPKNFGSNKSGDRLILQKRMLCDAWSYLAEKDPKVVKSMEDEMGDDRNPQWRSWFEHAKKSKKSRMRRNKKQQKQGKDEEDDDEEDSTYESEQEQPSGAGRPSDRAMPPPAKSAGNGKRKAGDSGLNKAGNTPKKPTRGKGGLADFLRSSRDLSPRMSGGLGARGGRLGSRSSLSRSVNGSIDDSDDNESQIFDPRPPDGMPNHAIRAHNFDNIPPPNGTRVRGNSREPSIPPFSEWELDEVFRQDPDLHQQIQNSILDGGSGDNVDEDAERRMREANGDVPEDEAIRQAREASMSVPPPDHTRNDDIPQLKKEAISGT